MLPRYVCGCSSLGGAVDRRRVDARATPASTGARARWSARGSRGGRWRPLGVLAADEVVDVVHERATSCRRPRSPSRTPARSRCARRPADRLRVDEVDLQLAPREPTVALMNFSKPCHRVGRALEQARLERVLDVGDHGDPDLVRGDADVGGLERLPAATSLRPGDADRPDRGRRRQRAIVSNAPRARPRLMVPPRHA